MGTNDACCNTSPCTRLRRRLPFRLETHVYAHASAGGHVPAHSLLIPAQMELLLGAHIQAQQCMPTAVAENKCAWLLRGELLAQRSCKRRGRRLAWSRVEPSYLATEEDRRRTEAYPSTSSYTLDKHRQHRWERETRLD